MSRGQRLQADTEARYPTLLQLLGCYLHADWLIDCETPQQAVDTAIAACPLAFRQQARRELIALLGSTDDDTRLRRVLNDGLCINLFFRKPADARAFAEEVERKLLASVRAGFEKRREERKR